MMPVEELHSPKFNSEILIDINKLTLISSLLKECTLDNLYIAELKLVLLPETSFPLTKSLKVL